MKFLPHVLWWSHSLWASRQQLSAPPSYCTHPHDAMRGILQHVYVRVGIHSMCLCASQSISQHAWTSLSSLAVCDNSNSDDTAMSTTTMHTAMEQLLPRACGLLLFAPTPNTDNKQTTSLSAPATNDRRRPTTTNDDRRRQIQNNTATVSSCVRAFVCATFAVTVTATTRRRTNDDGTTVPARAVSSGICRFPTLHGGCLLSNAVPNASSKQSANTRYCTRVCYISCCMVHTMKRTISPGPGLRALGCAVGCRCTRHATESVAVSAARSECLALRFAWGPRTETTPVGS